jgi:hypothetical protein
MRYATALCALILCVAARAQQAPNVKFGKIDPADLQKKVYAIDSSASAVVLYEAGSTEVKVTPKAGFRWCTGSTNASTFKKERVRPG